MSGWTAILLAALVAARAPKGTFSGSGGESAVPSAAQTTAVAESMAPAANAESAGTSVVAAVSESTGAVAAAAESTPEGGKAAKAGKKASLSDEEKVREEERARNQRLTAFWKKTPHYFIGTYGILCVIGMCLAMYWLARYARRRERSVYYFRALLVTLAALVLANWTYFDIAQRLDVDRTAQEAAGRAWQEEVKSKEVKEAKTLGEKVEQMRFAEESDADRKELKNAGQKGESQKDELDKALEAVQSPPPEDNEPEYRKKGRQKRDASTNKTAMVDAGAATGEVVQEKPWRVMVENDMLRATTYGRMLLFFAQLACWLALLAFLADYMSRFNLTFDYYFPLPLGLIWADRLVPKKLTTFCRGAPREKVAPYLEDLIRKGETFVYFGQSDPIPDRDKLHRFSFGRLHLLPVRKFVCSSQKPWDGSDFVLESSWFGRGCFVMEGESVAERLRADMVEFLLLRQRSRAWASQTMHFVWDHPTPPPFAVMDDMLACGRNTNLKMVVFSAAVPASQATTLFEEAHEAFPVPRPSPALLDRFLRGGAADTISWLLATSWTMLVNAGRAVWPWVLRTPGYLRRAVGTIWALVCIVALAIGRGCRWAWPAVRGIGKVLWIAVRFLGRAVWAVCRGSVTVLGKAGRAVGGMFGNLTARSSERKEKKAAEKARRDAEWKRILEVKRLAEEKAKQAAAAKAAAKAAAATARPAKEGAEKPDGDKTLMDKPAAEKTLIDKPVAEKPLAEKAVSSDASSPVVKLAGVPPPPQSKAALMERIKAKQKEQSGGKKVDLAQLIKAKQAAAQAKAAGTGPLAKGGDAGPAAAAAIPVVPAKNAPVPSPVQPAPQPPSAAAVPKPEVPPEAKATPDQPVPQPSVVVSAPKPEDRSETKVAPAQPVPQTPAVVVAPKSEAKSDDTAERQAKEKAERDARERAEQEARIRAETEERLRKEREEAERVAQAKAEENARKAREQAEAAERARLDREAADLPAEEVASEPAAASAGVATPGAPAGGKRFVIVKKAGQAPSKPPAAAAMSRPKEKPPVAPAAAPDPDETEQEKVRPGHVPASAQPREGKKFIVMKKHAGGVAGPAATEPRPPAPPAPQHRAPLAPPEPAPELSSEEIRFHCPHCGQHLAAPFQLAGRQLPCTHCKKPIVVPMGAGHAAPNAVPASGSTIMTAPMPTAAAPHPPVRVSFVPPRPMTQPPGQVRPPVFGAQPQPPPQPQPQPQAADDHFKFFCPHCGQKLGAKREWVGKTIKCPACQNSVVIPPPM